MLSVGASVLLPLKADPAFCVQRVSWFANLKRDEVKARIRLAYM
jgi:hypothetical protein